MTGRIHYSTAFEPPLHSAAGLSSVRKLALAWCPRQDSNLRSRLRRAVLYPLSYGGNGVTDYQSRAHAPSSVTTAPVTPGSATLSTRGHGVG